MRVREPGLWPPRVQSALKIQGGDCVLTFPSLEEGGCGGYEQEVLCHSY